MKKLMLGLLLLLFTFQCKSQILYGHQYSTVPESARYEIIQSERGARNTFKIDKYKGDVYQMAIKENEDFTWVPIIFLIPPDRLIDKEDEVNYQLFVSGLGARHIYLINIHSGKTWQLAEDTESGITFWYDFE